jgi:hypothetical protein
MGLKKITVILSLPLFLTTCMQGVFDTLNRSTSDPFTEIPTVRSFIEYNTVLLNWSWDEGADEYILERATDRSLTLEYQEIYRGTGTTYKDSGLPDEASYLYRLKKRRGEKIFPASGPALGVSRQEIVDVHEVNDTEERAVQLNHTELHLNMFYYRSYTGLTISDVDWFYVDIPPQWRVSIVIADQEAPTSSADTHFRYYIKNMDKGVITQNTNLDIRNVEDTMLRCYFKLYPLEKIFVSDDSLSGGDIINYTIKIGALVPGTG